MVGAASCAPPRDVSYCKQYGERVGTVEFSKCLDYFHKQDEVFRRDLAICNEEADVTYPPSLYDYDSPIHYGVGVGHGHHGKWRHSEGIYYEMSRDDQRNAMIDELRHRIILPCMQKHGWESARSWELGRINKR